MLSQEVGSRAARAAPGQVAARRVVVAVGTTLVLLLVAGCPPPESPHPFTAPPEKLRLFLP